MKMAANRSAAVEAKPRTLPRTHGALKHEQASEDVDVDHGWHENTEQDYYQGYFVDKEREPGLKQQDSGAVSFGDSENKAQRGGKREKHEAGQHLRQQTHPLTFGGARVFQQPLLPCRLNTKLQKNNQQSQQQGGRQQQPERIPPLDKIASILQPADLR